jgi:hypothetical protein
MNKFNHITQQQVIELFDYVDGNLYWKKAPTRHMHDGQIAGHVDKHGYRNIYISGKRYKMHRLIWLLHYGELPTIFIDHIDANGANSKIENLRLATKSQNALNRGKQANNTSGFKGVSKTPYGTYGARIMINSKYVSLGYFKNIEDAAEAYKIAAFNHHGEFARVD